MLSQKLFALLATMKSHPAKTQRDYADLLGISLGTTNKLLAHAKADGLIGEELTELTKKGLLALAPYKVDNAIIMAAGMSRRFVPLSLEKPKGLYVVKGEVLIERQIRQLKEAGIDDITIVVGYLKEQFFYLEEKFGVKLVTNEDYYRYNNTSTLMAVAHQLGNTYICSSDNYFTQNVFSAYEYRPYYAAMYAAGATKEYCLHCAANGRIKNVSIGGGDSWFMIGHVYFDASFSKDFVRILQKEYAFAETREHLWEDVFAKHTKELPLHIKKYDDGTIYEFDSLDELRLFDPAYVNNTDSKIFDNLCGYFKCSPAEISGLTPINEGLTNISFRFQIHGDWYVYRHPGIGTDAYIDRSAEAQSMHYAKQLGLDKTFLYMDKSGWKLSRYRNNARNLDYHDEEDVRRAIGLIKRLHNADIAVDYDFDIWGKTLRFIQVLKAKGKAQYADFSSLEKHMQDVWLFAEADKFPRRLCHCDCYAPNFMVHDEGMDLIDWEYSGKDDPANDLGTFICCAEDYAVEDAVRVLEIYYEREPSPAELRHCMAYVAISSWYWFVWALYQESLGKSVGRYLHIWYKACKMYADKALQLYRDGQ